MSHTAERWCEDLRCKKCYGAGAWQAAKVTELGAMLAARDARVRDLLDILRAFAGPSDFAEWHPKYHEAIARARAALKEKANG